MQMRLVAQTEAGGGAGGVHLCVQMNSVSLYSVMKRDNRVLCAPVPSNIFMRSVYSPSVFHV